MDARELATEIEYAECLGEQLETYYQLFYDYYAETEKKPDKKTRTKHLQREEQMTVS